MPPYVDTGVLVKLHIAEPDSSRAVELVRTAQVPFPFTQWQELELRNAIRLKVFRREITAAELALAMESIQSDLDSGVLVPKHLDSAAVLRMAEELSSRSTARLGCRTLDIVHVAAARILGVDEFLTFDNRQAALAREVGLEVRGA